MTKPAVRRSISDLQKESENLYRNAKALHPDVPASHLVPHMIEMAEPEFLAELDIALRSQHFLKIARASIANDRRKQSAPEQLLFPELKELAAELPQRIPIGGGEFVELLKLHYKNLKQYLKVLNERDRQRHEKRIAAVKKLMELWPPRSTKNRGMTLAQLDAQKAKRAGLI